MTTQPLEKPLFCWVGKESKREEAMHGEIIALLY